MKICLFGGSFDPVHSGHLTIAEAAQQSANLDKVIFLLHLGDDLGGEGLQGDLGVDKHEVAVLGLEIGAEGGGQQGGGEALSVLLHGGHGGVDVLDLGIVELVAGVDGLADLGQGAVGEDMLLLLLHIAWRDELRVDSLGAELNSTQQILKLPQVEDILGNILFSS